MKLFNRFALTTLLLLGSGSLVFGEQPQLHHKPPSHSSPRTKQAPPQKQDDFINAVIRSIDRQLGVLDLDTEIGWMQVKVAPEEVQDFHVGDKLQMRELSS